jgi:hypothetical protein
VCDACACDLEVTGVSSIFKLIRSDPVLVRMLPTVDLSCEENNVSEVGLQLRSCCLVLRDKSRAKYQTHI